MAPRTKPAQAQAQPAEEMDFKDLLAEIKADIAKNQAGGPVQYLKENGEYVVKLLLPKGAKDIRGFYAGPYQGNFKGTVTQNYLICGVILEAPADGVANKDRVRYIKVGSQIMNGIVDALGRWKGRLFAADGPTIVINRREKSNKTEYTAAPGPDTFDATGLEHPELSIQEAVEKEIEKDSKQESEAPAAPRKPSTARRSVSSDDDDIPF